MGDMQDDVVCAVCGSRAWQVTRTEPTDLYAPDFDTRPGGPHAIDTWIAECPHCGYCATDLTAAPAGSGEIVSSEAYQERLNEGRYPRTARRFLCYALLLEKLHHWADAGWLWLQAAWACDDAEAEEAAVDCRTCALDRWKRGKELGQAFADDLASEFAIVTDLYRRIGEFENATVTCAEGLDLDDIPLSVEHMLRRQMVLIQQHDRGRHSMLELQLSPTS